MDYQYHKLKNEKVLPKDINLEFEEWAKRKKSNHLLYMLNMIRETKAYTGNKPGAILINVVTGDILCYVEAHNGVVKELRHNTIKIHNEAPLLPIQKAAYRNIWDDKNTKSIMTSTIRNPRVDWTMPKKDKLWDAKKEEKVKKEKGSD